MPQTTDSSSLDSIQARIAAKFSAPVTEENAAPTTPPEPTPETPAPESQQAPAAPSDEPEASEQATPEHESEQPEQPQKYSVKIDGKDHEVTLDDLLKGYSFTEHNTRKSQQIAEERKALEAERQKFQTEETATLRAKRDQYDTYLAQLSEAIQSVTPKEPDWETHRMRVSPEQFAADVLLWDQNKKHLEKVEAERKRVAEEKDAEAAAGFTAYKQQQYDLLREAIPDLNDPAKADTIREGMAKQAETYGYTRNDLKQAVDHRLLRMLYDAHLYHASKAKAPAIENKIEKVLATSQPGSRTTAQPKNELDVAKARARQSGKTDDIAEVIRLKGLRRA